MIPKTKKELARYFDHTLLHPTAVEADVRRHCDEALRYGFYSVCVQPRWVSVCADLLHATDVQVVSVAGFPFGADRPQIKAAQAEAVIQDGADEVDFVADLASILTGDATYLSREFASVRRACRKMHPPVVLKVIIESAALTDEQIRFVCGIAQAAGIDFVKTGTGFLPDGGARVEHVRLMAQAAPKCKIKAAGGIKTAEQALAMIGAGAARIGASASVHIVDQFQPHDDIAH